MCDSGSEITTYLVTILCGFGRESAVRRRSTTLYPAYQNPLIFQGFYTLRPECDVGGPRGRKGIRGSDTFRSLHSLHVVGTADTPMVQKCRSAIFEPRHFTLLHSSPYCGNRVTLVLHPTSGFRTALLFSCTRYKFNNIINHIHYF